MRQKLDAAPAIKTMAEAEGILKNIYDLDKKIRTYETRRDRMIETAQKNCVNLTANLVRDRDLLAAGLEAFSRETLGLDGGPKSHDCQWGKFGLRRQTRLVIDDIMACVKALQKKGLDACIKTTWGINRHVLGQQDESVIESVGARRESEDVFFWETSPLKRGD